MSYGLETYNDKQQSQIDSKTILYGIYKEFVTTANTPFEVPSDSEIFIAPTIASDTLSYETDRVKGSTTDTFTISCRDLSLYSSTLETDYLIKNYPQGNFSIKVLIVRPMNKLIQKDVEYGMTVYGEDSTLLYSLGSRLVEILSLETLEDSGSAVWDSPVYQFSEESTVWTRAEGIGQAWWASTFQRVTYTGSI
jgi:hypothetical protein